VGKLLIALIVSFVVWTQFLGPRIAANRPPDLTGRWREVGGTASLDLLKGGGVVASLVPGGDHSLAGKYRVDGNALLLHLGGPAARAARYPFELDGDDLIVEIAGQPHRFRRKV
jgi:hypothetical protein